MESIQTVQNLGALKQYRALKAKSVASILASLNLEEKIFVVLVAGKKVSTDYIVSEGEEITILPKIAGG